MPVPDLGRQTKSTPYPPDVVRFGDALESIMGEGIHDLEGIVEQLNARRVAAAGHTAWTPESFRAFVAELAQAPD
jgi:Recombinase-like helix-turn-helix domain